MTNWLDPSVVGMFCRGVLRCHVAALPILSMMLASFQKRDPEAWCFSCHCVQP